MEYKGFYIPLNDMHYIQKSTRILYLAHLDHIFT